VKTFAEARVKGVKLKVVSTQPASPSLPQLPLGYFTNVILREAWIGAFPERKVNKPSFTNIMSGPNLAKTKQYCFFY